MQVLEPRPPYVVFETKAVEDRQASIEAGFYKTRDIDFAVVTPQGSKDRIERNAQEWFEQLAQQSQEGRFPAQWLTAFRETYKAWKEGREIPLDGTSVTMWPVASPSQVKQLLDAKLRTVEDLAVANEESLSRLGMGGRALKEKAANWLSAAGSSGKMAEEMSALRVEVAGLKDRNAELEGQVRALLAQLKQLTPEKASK